MFDAPFSHDINDYPEGIVIPVDKPYRWTSADVIRKVKWLACKHFGKKNLKVGHAGTLDPLATGILLVCIGAATRKADELQRSPKEYLAGISFGAVTASYDMEKDIDRVCPLDKVSEDRLLEVLPDFIGEQEQIAPLFSAKSVDGVRSYEKARKLLAEAHRKGIPYTDPEGLVSSARINIYGMELVSWSESPVPVADDGLDTRGKINVADISGYKLPTALLKVKCSKGTYIRALARDLGEALGSGAFLTSLRRTGNGGFGIEDAVGIEKTIKLFEI